MDTSKQVIVLRKDLFVKEDGKDGSERLNRRLGKAAAMVAHASMKVFFDHILEEMETGDDGESLGINIFMPKHGEAIASWINGSFTKIVVGADDEQQLIDIYNAALQKGLPTSLIIDSGRTEFKNVPTKTACAVGPASSNLVDEITGHLKLL